MLLTEKKKEFLVKKHNEGRPLISQRGRGGKQRLPHGGKVDKRKRKDVSPNQKTGGSRSEGKKKSRQTIRSRVRQNPRGEKGKKKLFVL